jgi:hypothetical protein
MNLDINALRERLREYEPSIVRCPNKVEEVRDDAFLYHPCGRPEGHEGACGNVRMVLGFPGYASLAALLDEVERLRENAEARERVMRRENVILRAAERERDELRADVRDAEKGAAACDQMLALLDGLPVSDPCPEAARVAALLAENTALRELLDAKSHEAGLYARRMEQAQRSRDEARAEERAAVVAWLRRKATDDFCALRVKEACDAEKSADVIERGEHRREEEE